MFRLFLPIAIVAGLAFGTPLNESIGNSRENGGVLDSTWRCAASSGGFDRHGLHFANGSTLGDARAKAINACELFHFPGACHIERCAGT